MAANSFSSTHPSSNAAILPNQELTFPLEMDLASDNLDVLVNQVIAACFRIGASGPSDVCAICLENFNPSTTDCDNNGHSLPKCREHNFHLNCIRIQLERYGKCAVCRFIYIETFGDQPKEGTMTTTVYRAGELPLAGFEDHGTIRIVYNFSGGIQSPIHPNPGHAYSGTIRHAYLPGKLLNLHDSS